jgi:hypothetical protein
MNVQRGDIVMVDWLFCGLFWHSLSRLANSFHSNIGTPPGMKNKPRPKKEFLRQTKADTDAGRTVDAKGFLQSLRKKKAKKA